MCRRQINERCTTRCAVSGKKSYGCITPLVGTGQVALVPQRTLLTTGSVCSNGLPNTSIAVGKARTRVLIFPRFVATGAMQWLARSYIEGFDDEPVTQEQGGSGECRSRPRSSCQDFSARVDRHAGGGDMRKNQVPVFIEE